MLKTTPEQRARLRTELQQGQWPTVPAWAVSLLDDFETLLGALRTIQQAARTRAVAPRSRAASPGPTHPRGCSDVGVRFLPGFQNVVDDVDSP